jgi:hypothetical protein
MSDVTDPPGPTPDTASTTEPSPAPGPDPSASPSALPSTPIPVWSTLDAGTRMVAGAGIAAALVVLIGGVVGAWGSSTEFLVITLLAAIVAAVAAWSSAEPRVVAAVPIALEIVATLAAAVLAVLAIWRLIEVLFDFDQLDRYAGVVGFASTAALAALGLAVLWFALQRDTTTASALRSTDRSTRLALGGLVLVLVAWAIMLSSYWTMHAAATTLALTTLAALIVVLAGRGLPAITAWAGVVGAVLVILLALDQWGELARFSDGRFDLGISDLLPFLIYGVGVVLVIAAGALTGMAAMPRTPASPAPPTPPSSAV